jgi:hypothetical protein
MNFFNLPNHSSRTKPRGLPETLKKMFHGSKVPAVRGVDNLTAIYKPIV